MVVRCSVYVRLVLARNIWSDLAHRYLTQVTSFCELFKHDYATASVFPVTTRIATSMMLRFSGLHLLTLISFKSIETLALTRSYKVNVRFTRHYL